MENKVPRFQVVPARVAVLVIAAAILVAFLGVIGNDFVGWDDDYNILRNDRFRGLDGEHLRWMFTTGFGGHYQPLTWLSFAIDSQLLWGVNAAGFHFANLLLHGATAIGFFFVAVRLLDSGTDPPLSPLTKGGRRGVDGVLQGAMVAALLFAVHPLRVESVAWATERRDVLSGAWLVVTVLCYLKSTEGEHARRPLWFGLSLACYGLSLLSKASGMTLPVVLLLLDFYPLRRSPLRTVILEKVVFLIPALAFAAAALWAQSDAGALRSFSDHPLSLRIVQACFGILYYPVKTLWPVDLVPLYEQRPDASPWEPLNLLCVAGVVGVSILVWSMRRRRPSLAVTWATYIVLLSPVLGLAQSGLQLVADRYSYLPSMAIAVLVGGAVTKLWQRFSSSRFRRSVMLVCVGLCVLLMVQLTRSQVLVWKDSETLWRTVLSRRPDTPTAHANLAVVLNHRGAFEEARSHAAAALARLPGNRTAHAALARASLELGELTEAEHHSRIALHIADRIGRPDTTTMIGLAIVQTRLGRPDEAEKLYRDVIALEPAVAEWHFDLGGFLASHERYIEARTFFETTIQLEPSRADAYLRLGVVYMNLGDAQRAVETWKAGLRQAPDDSNLRMQLEAYRERP